MTNSRVQANRCEFHHDLVYEILTRLPVKTLSRFCCVCKPWNSLISHPVFQADHYRRQSPVTLVAQNEYDGSWNYVSTVHFSTYSADQGLLLNSFSKTVPKTHCSYQMSHSCRGLVCLWTPTGQILLCNPSTKELIELPQPSSGEGRYEQQVGFGLAATSGDNFPKLRTNLERTLKRTSFLAVGSNLRQIFRTRAADFPDAKLNESSGAFWGADCLGAEHRLTPSGDFKVVRFFRRAYPVKKCCEIFTVGSSQCWRGATSPPFPPRLGGMPHLHGALHLLPERLSEVQYIAVFDIDAEEYRGEISLPDIYFAERRCVDTKFSEVSGSLCLTFNNIRTQQVAVWMLKDYNSGNWVKQYSIDFPSTDIDLDVSPLAIMGDGILLYCYDSLKVPSRTLQWYFSKDTCLSRSIETLKKKKKGLVSVVQHVEGFFALPKLKPQL